jgi:hypothetical protein
MFEFKKLFHKMEVMLNKCHDENKEEEKRKYFKFLKNIMYCDRSPEIWAVATQRTAGYRCLIRGNGYRQLFKVSAATVSYSRN